MELALLSRRGAGRDDGELPALQVEPGPTKDLAIAVDDHPFVEIRMQGADVVAELVVRVAVHDPAGLFAAGAPTPHSVTGGRLCNTRWRRRSHGSPGASGVERAGKSSEQVRLKNDLVDDASRRHARAHLELAPH